MSNLEAAGDTNSASDPFASFQKSMALLYEVDNPPPVAVVRAVQPEEIDTLMQECLADAGWPLPEGGYAVPKAQVNAFHLAQYECAAKYPPDPKLSTPLTQSQKSFVYDYVTNEEVPCIESFGYAIDNVPSRETFIATFDSNQWFPFTQLRETVSQEEWDRVYDKCPQSPPSSDIYAH